MEQLNETRALKFKQLCKKCAGAARIINKRTVKILFSDQHSVNI